MSTMSPDTTVERDALEVFEFDIICDIAQMRHVSSEFPACRGDAARWVAWLPNCCPQAPQYRLVCDRCKAIYQAWQARNAYIYCGFCNAETGGAHSFTPLKG